jgi:cell division transport system permease protein
MNRFIRFVKRNIRRTPYQAVAASMVMFVTFLILILFSVLLIGAQRILQYYEQRPQAIAFFKDSAAEADIKAIEKRLHDTGKTTEVKYISKQDALKYYNEMNKDEPILLELVTANILPASLEISTTSPGDLISIAEMVKKEPVIDDVLVPKDVIQTLTQAINGTRWIGMITAGFLVVFSFFLLLMVIGFKIRIKRSEIETMKLLGASTWFIRIPFLLEGIT